MAYLLLKRKKHTLSQRRRNVTTVNLETVLCLTSFDFHNLTVCAHLQELLDYFFYLHKRKNPTVCRGLPAGMAWLQIRRSRNRNLCVGSWKGDNVLEIEEFLFMFHVRQFFALDEHSMFAWPCQERSLRRSKHDNDKQSLINTTKYRQTRTEFSRGKTLSNKNGF